MLSAATIIDVIADRLEAWGVSNLVIDPVMVAKSGDALLQPTAVRTLVKRLLPLALVITPNIPEAEVLSGKSITDARSEEEAARIIAGLGPRYVVIKGGHRESGNATDVIFDGCSFERLESARVETTNTHGTGCTFSAAITANLALGHTPMMSIALAKQYLTEALAQSFPIGSGHSPVNHFHAIPAADPRMHEVQRST
jgi:hydroxymethylpyrimidine/phosphomethylpyrimidine kinase